jgi:hypothetical protein
LSIVHLKYRKTCTAAISIFAEGLCKKQAR